MSEYLKELRERLLQKLYDEWESKWSKYPLVTDDDFNVLYNQFNEFLIELIDDINSVVENKHWKISKENLRRILENKKETRYQSHTRNCLAVYVGFDSWDDFILKVKPFVEPLNPITHHYIQIIKPSFWDFTQPKKEPLLIDEIGFTDYEEIHKKSLNKNVPYSIIFGFLVSSISIFYIYQWYKNRPFTNEQLAKVKFEFISQYDKPNTSTLKLIYDVSSLNTDSVTVDYGYDEFYLSGTDKIIKNQNYTEKYSKKSDTLSHTYFKPNVWAIKLIVKGKTIRTLNKIVYSGKEWTSWSSGKENQTLWVGKILSPSKSMKNGILHFDKNDMEKQGGLDFYNTKHQINDDFLISGDSTYFETKIRNSETESGFRNYDTSISFVDENRSMMSLNLIQDCIEYGVFTIAETQFSGKKKYLPFLDVNVQEWRLVGIKLKDKTATIFIDGKKIFETPYKGELSKIKGIRFSFKGCGSVDWIKLTNSHNGQVAFFDDFIR